MRVLVVDDERDLASAIARGLRRDGIAVDEAYDGDAALEKALLTEYDVIVLDRNLPRMHGDEVCRSLREAGAAARVLMLTAAVEVADRVDGLNLGADDYLTKPFSVRELLARVRVALRRSSGEDEPAATPAAVAAIADTPIVIDTERHEVRRNGEPIALAPKEFELLAYLVRHPNQVCTRDQILESVWGYTYEGETRTVDVHIHWLRQKLEDNPARPQHLLTVRHYGYKYTPIPAA